MKLKGHNNYKMIIILFILIPYIPITLATSIALPNEDSICINTVSEKEPLIMCKSGSGYLNLGVYNKYNQSTTKNTISIKGCLLLPKNKISTEPKWINATLKQEFELQRYTILKKKTTIEKIITFFTSIFKKEEKLNEFLLPGEKGLYRNNKSIDLKNLGFDDGQRFFCEIEVDLGIGKYEIKETMIS